MLEPLSVLNLFMTICLLAGGVIAYRHGIARTANEVQERVISALQSEMEILQTRISTLEKENTRLSELLMTIRSALKRRGIHITIDGDMISIHSSPTHTTRIFSSENADRQREDEAAPIDITQVVKASKKHTRTYVQRDEEEV